jgi:hypothetical protein
MIEIVEARRTHILPIAAAMAAVEQDMAPGGRTYRVAIRGAFEASFYRRAALIDGRVVALWGVTDTSLSSDGEVWLALTEAARTVPLTVARVAMREIRRLLAVKIELRCRIVCSDVRAIRFARHLGFDIRDAVPGDTPCFMAVLRGPLAAPAISSGAPPPPFIVYALARSRTAWLSRFLTYGAWTCHHEQAIYMRRPREFFALMRRPNTGTAETAAAQGWQLLHHRVPGIRAVVVRRPVEDAVRSMMNVDLHGAGIYDEGDLRRTLTNAARCLDKISALPGVLTVECSDLAREDACAAVFEHCLPYDFDADWWQGLRHENVQIDAASLFHYFHHNRASVDGFKKACKSEMRSLVRSGSLGQRVT